MKREKRKLAYLVWRIQFSGAEIMDALNGEHFDKAGDVLLSFIKNAAESFDDMDEVVRYAEQADALDFMPPPFNDETVDEDLLDSCRWLLFLQNWETDSDTTRH